MTYKRNDYISWNEYFMALAYLASFRSKDPKCQVGCCIIDPDTKKILSMGYNGFPRGISDDEFPWDKSSNNFSEQKYAYVVHSELNAILNAENKDLAGKVIYITHFPCNECAKAIIQAGISKIVYDDTKKDTMGNESAIAAEKMFEATGVDVIKYNSDSSLILTYMKAFNKLQDKVAKFEKEHSLSDNDMKMKQMLSIIFDGKFDF